MIQNQRYQKVAVLFYNAKKIAFQMLHDLTKEKIKLSDYAKEKLSNTWYRLTTKRTELGGFINTNHKLDVYLQPCRWPFFFSDQIFLPTFKVKIKNHGPTIEDGLLEIDITKFSNIEYFSEISVYNGPFQDVFHRRIMLKTGEEIILKFKIQSRFIAPGEYAVRVKFTEFIKQEPYDPKDDKNAYLLKKIRGNPNIVTVVKDKNRKANHYFIETDAENPNSIILHQPLNETIRHLEEMINLAPKSKAMMKRGNQLFDRRLIDRIKVHPLTFIVAVYGIGFALFGLLFGAISAYKSIIDILK